MDAEDNSALVAEGGNSPLDDVIQLEDLEAPPAKLCDLTEDIQDLLAEVNLGSSEDKSKPIYESGEIPNLPFQLSLRRNGGHKGDFLSQCCRSNGLWAVIFGNNYQVFFSTRGSGDIKDLYNLILKRTKRS